MYGDASHCTGLHYKHLRKLILIKQVFILFELSYVLISWNAPTPDTSIPANGCCGLWTARIFTAMYIESCFDHLLRRSYGKVDDIG